MPHSFSTFRNFVGFPHLPPMTGALTHSTVQPAEGGVGGVWRADRACSTFPSDRTEGIKTVSNIESLRQEGAGQRGLRGLCLRRTSDAARLFAGSPQLSQLCQSGRRHVGLIL